MENTYNYFFSSTPQVLAGIFGLFAVFIIFKINEIKNQINILKDKFLKELKEYVTSIERWDDNYAKAITSTIKDGNVDEIILKIDDILFFFESLNNKPVEHVINSFKIKYDKIIKFRKELIDKTIYSSIITSIAIIYCLIMIIPGSFINHCVLWSIIAFLPAIGLTIFIFFKLISIIRYSFKD